MNRRRRRLSVRSRDGSSVVFNDLLFNALAVFIVLIMVLLISIGVPDVSASDLENSKREAEEQAQEVSRISEQLQEEQEQREMAERDRDRMAQEVVQARNDAKPRPIEVVLVVDGTNSMQPVLDELCTVALTVAEVGSRIAPRFRLGIIVYRDTAGTAVFPLTEIGPSHGDVRSPGMRELVKFIQAKTVKVSLVEGGDGETGGRPSGDTRMVSKMAAVMGLADIESGVRRASAMLGASSEISARQVVVVMGDTGPWEMDGQRDSISLTDRRSGERIIDMVKTLGSSAREARMLTLFTGKNVAGLSHRAETIQFFRDLAAAKGSSGRYSDDASQILATVVEAMLSPGESGRE